MWSVVVGQWVGRGPVGGLVVGCQWSVVLQYAVNRNGENLSLSFHQIP